MNLQTNLLEIACEDIGTQEGAWKGDAWRRIWLTNICTPAKKARIVIVRTDYVASYFASMKGRHARRARYEEVSIS